VRFLGPDLASEAVTFDLIMFVLVGGIGTLLGPLAGTFIVTGLTQSLQFLQDYRMVVFGPVLVALIIFLPDGLVGTWMKRRARLAKVGPQTDAGTVGTNVSEAKSHA
jgi:branched-chain amino acid transport system permease protein